MRVISPRNADSRAPGVRPGPRCPRHPSGPCAPTSGTPSLSPSPAFGLGAPFLRDVGVARSSGAGALVGAPVPIPTPASHPRSELASRFPPGGGPLLSRKARPNRFPKGGSPESGRLRPVPPAQHQQPLPPTADAPLLTASRPSGTSQSLLASCPCRPCSRCPLGSFPVEHSFLAAMSWKAEVRERRGRSQELGAMRFKTGQRIAGLRPPSSLGKGGRSDPAEEPGGLQSMGSLRVRHD